MPVLKGKEPLVPVPMNLLAIPVRVLDDLTQLVDLLSEIACSGLVVVHRIIELLPWRHIRLQLHLDLLVAHTNLQRQSGCELLGKRPQESLSDLLH